MPEPATAITGGVGLVGNILGSRSQAKSASQAAASQERAALEGIAEQRRQFDVSQRIMQDMYNQGRQIMNPYVQAGYQAIGAPTSPFRPVNFADQALNAYAPPQQAETPQFAQPVRQPAYTGTPSSPKFRALEEVWARQAQPQAQPSAFRQKPSHVGSVGGAVGGILGGGVPAQQAQPSAFAGGPRTLGFYQEGAKTGMPVVSDVAGRTGGAYDVMGQFMGRGAEAGRRQAALAGLGTPEEYQQEVALAKASPEYQTMLKEGEEAILARASATGGLRGGATIGSLMEYRPRLLADMLNKRYQQLGGLAGTGLQTAGQIGGAGLGAGQYLTDIGRTTTGQLAQLGQAAAAQQAAAGSNLAGNIGTLGAGMAGSIGNLLAQGGAAQAGGLLQAGQARSDMWGQLGGLAKDIGKIATDRGWSFGGNTPPVTTPPVTTGQSPIVGDRASFLRLGYP